MWLDYFIKSAWIDHDTFYRIHETAYKIYAEQKKFAAKISAQISGKSRAFFLDADISQQLKDIFMVQDADEVIIADSRDAIRKLLESMAISRGKKIFIIAVMFYRELAKILTKAGFVEGRDFVDGSDFFEIANYVSIEIVKSM